MPDRGSLCPRDGPLGGGELQTLKSRPSQRPVSLAHTGLSVPHAQLFPPWRMEGVLSCHDSRSMLVANAYSKGS